MDKNSAKNLIKKTLQNPFDKEQFVYFIKNLLNRIDESKAFHARGYVPEIFKGFIKTYERIATYTDPEENKIDILIVYLQRETTLGRARTAQRNFIARYLKGRGEKDAGLIAFVSPNRDDWRFSFVKMEYKLVETPSGKIKAKEEFTPARRFSFLVGKNENSHTAQSCLVPILESDISYSTLEELEKTFSIEKVTKEFFEKYRDLFLKTKEALDEIVTSDPKIENDFTQKGVNTVDFAKKLLGQIVFLYFLQKKGWFGVAENKNWGEGDKQFLRNLFEQCGQKGQDFFNDYLEFLFYDALNKENRGGIDPSYYPKFHCKIPFLNGGLFDPINDYDWKYTDILLPNRLFSNTNRTKEGDIGTGILDVFDRYNFTVKEDEPLEKEVAVDPEMLGKVFENLLEVKDRKSKGTYYTPREIVHYMCQESLINYLTTECEEIVSKEDIETLIRYGELAVEHDNRVQERGMETATYSYKLPESIRNNAELIDAKLADIRVCDPAIGSGAFPVGMMNEIIRARSVLATYIKNKKHYTMYDFKRHAIQNCLYGVDIDPGAVEIAKLRLWLSLIVDEEDIEQIKPLPNLDYKIMQGNSLLEEYEGIKLFDEKLLSMIIKSDDMWLKELKNKEGEISKKLLAYYQENPKWMRNRNIQRPIDLYKLERKLDQIRSSIKYQIKSDNFLQTTQKQVTINFDGRIAPDSIWKQLKSLHNDFFETSQKAKKDKIEEKIERLEWQLIETTLKEKGEQNKIAKLKHFKRNNLRPFFLWKLHFAEVFQEKGGFDVVIANPPYISHDRIIASEKQSLRKHFESYEPFADYYCYFIELGLRLQNAQGGLCYITSNSYLRANYGYALRTTIRRRNKLLAIINIEGFQVFETAIVNTAILISQNNYGNDQSKCSVVNSSYSDDIPFDEFIDRNRFYYLQRDFLMKSWILVPKDRLMLKQRIESVGRTLEQHNTKIRLGLATGANSVFIISEDKKKELIRKDAKNKYIIKPILRGKDIFRYGYKFNNVYILLTKNGVDVKREYPEVFKYFDSFGKKFKKRGAQGKHWTNLRACSFLDDFERKKLIWIELSDRGRFALCDEKMYLLNTAYFLIPPSSLFAKYLLAVLNSKVIEFYLNLIAETSGMGTNRWINNFVKEFPIPEISRNEQRPFVRFADRVLTLTRSSDYLENPRKQARVKEYERQIDEMVYELYGLTKKEVEIVENSSKKEV